MNESGTRIDPFPTPDWFSLPGHTSSWDLHGTEIFAPIFALVFFIWCAYTLVVAYHWLRYGHRSFLTVPMLALHVVVSGVLILITVAGLK